jgi:hypothetical protein
MPPCCCDLSQAGRHADRLARTLTRRDGGDASARGRRLRLGRVEAPWRATLWLHRRSGDSDRGRLGWGLRRARRRRNGALLRPDAPRAVPERDWASGRGLARVCGAWRSHPAADPARSVERLTRVLRLRPGPAQAAAARPGTGSARLRPPAFSETAGARRRLQRPAPRAEAADRDGP